MLPCCCGNSPFSSTKPFHAPRNELTTTGPDCKDTAAFVKAANLYGFQTLLRGCKAQLYGTDLDFNSIDYGFKWKKSCPFGWAEAPTWKKSLAVVLFPFFLPWICLR